MSLTAATHGLTQRPHRRALGRDAGGPGAVKLLLGGQALANAALAFSVFLGGFVIYEPAPYELFLTGLLGIWIIGGMRVPRTVLPLLVLLLLFNCGGVVSSFQIDDWPRGIIYVAVSLFLALSAVFFACVIAADENRLPLIFKAYVAAAAITATLGILGYFGIPGFQAFTRYSRAMGVFQDPNVFGPFLVPPILVLMHGVLSGSIARLPLRAFVLLLLLFAEFLSFSRAAWGLTVVSALLLYLLMIVNEQSARIRFKYIALGFAGFAAIVLLLAAAMQVPAIADLVQQRVKVVQDYDGGREGRFARHWLGLLMATGKPLGIGPLEFGNIFPEDTHNLYLKALMDYGWLGFYSWMTMMLWTIIGGFKLLFRPRPWQIWFQIAYVVFIGHVLMGIVIDTDHWRHHYLLIGIVWGCMALEAQWQRKRQPGMLARMARKAQVPPRQGAATA